MLFSALLFYIFSSFSIISAFAVILSKNMVHNVIFLILAFVNVAGLFILLGAEFLAMLLIIVYVGAIAVLFLFVVMMLNIDEAKKKFGAHAPLIIFVSAILALEMYVIVSISDITSSYFPKSILVPIDYNISNTKAIGNILYTDFIFPFQMAGAILFVAIIGAIVLTMENRNRLIRKQSSLNQVNRKKEDSIKLVKVKSGEGIDI